MVGYPADMLQKLKTNGMKKIVFYIAIILSIASCSEKKSTKSENKQVKPISNKVKEDKAKQILPSTDEGKGIEKELKELNEAFSEIVKLFPKDSSSLYRFYFKWNSTEDKEKLIKQTKRLKALTSKESVLMYRNVENNLLPLLKEITSLNKVSKFQADSLVNLYSDYDYLSGESLHSHLFTDEENYKLVWESFKIMVHESSKDTTYINCLIRLDKNTKTNIELAEAMQDFKIQAIRNNPTGFLTMYGERKGELRLAFAKNATIWDDPDKELIEKFSNISKNSKNESQKNLAKELINQFKYE